MHPIYGRATLSLHRVPFGVGSCFEVLQTAWREKPEGCAGAPMPWPAPLGTRDRGQRCGLEQTSLPLPGSAECAELAQGVRPSHAMPSKEREFRGLKPDLARSRVHPAGLAAKTRARLPLTLHRPKPSPRALLTGRGVVSAGRRPAGSELRGRSLLQPSPGPRLRGAGQGGARGGVRAAAAAAASERCSRCPQAETQLESRRLAPAAPLLG